MSPVFAERIRVSRWMKPALMGLGAAALLLTGGCSMKLTFDPQSMGKSSAVEQDNNAVTGLKQLLASKDPQVRAIAAMELGGMGPKAQAAMPALAQLSSDPDRHVRFVAARSMTQIDPSDRVTVPMLVLVANDPQMPKDDRKAAMALLGDMGVEAQSAIPALERVQNEDTPEMRLAAREALSRIDLNRIQPSSAFGPLPMTSRWQSANAPTTQPTMRPVISGQRQSVGDASRLNNRTVDRVEASPAARVERPTTGPSAVPTTLPKPDQKTLGIAYYSAQQLQAVRDWIAHQNDMTDTQKREHVAHFEQWNRDQQAMVRDLQAASPNEAGAANLNR